MVMGLTVPYWLSGRRHYTMSLGLLQFHLSSDLNLTSKTFLFCLQTHQPGTGAVYQRGGAGRGISPRFPASAYSKSLPFSPFIFCARRLFKCHFPTLVAGGSGQFIFPLSYCNLGQRCACGIRTGRRSARLSLNQLFPRPGTRCWDALRGR